MNKLEEYVAAALRRLKAGMQPADGAHPGGRSAPAGENGPLDGVELALASRAADLALSQTLLRLEVLRCWLLLSPREREVALLVRDGCTNREAARRLTVSLSTAKTLARRAALKMQVGTRSELRRMMLAIDWEDELLQGNPVPPAASPGAPPSPRPP